MKLYSRIIKFLKPYSRYIIGSFFCTLLVSATTLLIAPLAGYVFQVIGDKNLALLNLGAIAMIILFVFKGLFVYGQDYLSNFVVNRVIVDLRNDLYEHIQDHSLDFYHKWNTGELVSRIMADIQTLQITLYTGFVTLLPHSILLVGLLVYIFWLNWQLSLVTLVAFPLIVQVIRLFAGEIREISEGVQQKAADITSHVQETISQIKIVKSFSMEKHELDKFKGETEKSFNISMKAVKISATQNPVVALLQTIAVVAVVWFGGAQIINGSLTLPQLISFATALAIMTDPGNSLSKGYSILQQGMASLKRIFEVIDVQPSIKDKPNALKLDHIQGKVEFKGLSFAYEQDQVLQNINLSVQPGEIIALVGRTGSGKSTLMNLLLRFYDPTTGAIFVDGHNLKDIQLDSLRRQIAVVPQEITLFRGTIKDNIAYGNPKAGMDQILQAAKQANAHQFIEKLSKGYESEVGERGSGLSGGERQRIAIARAILRDPKILILDEATSSLDAETESYIREALDHLMQNRTCFIIAHRLYTIKKASRIIVIDNKTIAETGTHDELIALGGIYQTLYDIQFKNT